MCFLLQQEVQLIIVRELLLRKTYSHTCISPICPAREMSSAQAITEIVKILEVTFPFSILQRYCLSFPIIIASSVCESFLFSRNILILQSISKGMLSFNSGLL